jgi:hypothetical protein
VGFRRELVKEVVLGKIRASGRGVVGDRGTNKIMALPTLSPGISY